jgi:hypothetical protein
VLLPLKFRVDVSVCRILSLAIRRNVSLPTRETVVRINVLQVYNLGVTDLFGGIENIILLGLVAETTV